MLLSHHARSVASRRRGRGRYERLLVERPRMGWRRHERYRSTAELRPRSLSAALPMTVTLSTSPSTLRTLLERRTLLLAERAARWWHADDARDRSRPRPRRGRQQRLLRDENGRRRDEAAFGRRHADDVGLGSGWGLEPRLVCRIRLRDWSPQRGEDPRGRSRGNNPRL